MTRRWLQSADVEIDESTGALAVARADAPRVVTPVTMGPTSRTLLELVTAAGAGIDAGLKTLTLVPRSGAAVYWNIGQAASAQTALLPASGYSFPCDAATAAALQFFATTTQIIDVFQHG